MEDRAEARHLDMSGAGDDGDERSRPTGVGIIAAIVLSSALALDPAGWFPFSVVKWWAVVATVLVAALSWVRLREVRRSPVLGWLLGLVVLVTVSAVFAVDGTYAWVGSPIRHLGVVAWWLFVLSFLVGAALGGRGPEPHAVAVRVSRAVVLGGLAVGSYSTWELFVGRPVEIDVVSDRLGGPYGSPAYLGAACCLILPVCLAHALDHAVRPAWRAVSAVAATGSTVAAVGSGSRGALLALGVALLLVGWSDFRESQPRGSRRKKAVMTALLGAVVLGLAAALRDVFERTVGWSSRLDEWELALRVIGSRPLMGAGPEGYRIEAFDHMGDDYVRRFGEDVFVDRAHSGMLDVAVSSGVLAAAAYIVVMALIVRAGFRAVRSDSMSRRGLGAAVIAYAVGQQLLFPIAELDPVFWLLVGVLCADGTQRLLVDGSATDRMRVLGAVQGGVMIFGAVAVLVVAVVGVRAVAADRVAKQAVDESDVEISAERAMRAVMLAPGDARFHLLLAQVEASERTLTSLNRAINAIDDAAEITPLDPGVRIERARLLSLRADATGTPSDRDGAERAWAELLDDAPSCARCHFGAALAAGERGDITRAVELLERAVELGNEDAARLLESLEI